MTKFTLSAFFLFVVFLAQTALSQETNLEKENGDSVRQHTLLLPQSPGQYHFAFQSQYPVLARLARLEGQSLLKVTLDEQGNVIEADLLKEQNPILDQEALRYLKSKVRFNSNNINRELVVSVIFKLQ